MTPGTIARQAPLSWDFPGKNTGVGYHFLLQEIFPTQGSNLHLLLGRKIPHHWAVWVVLQINPREGLEEATCTLQPSQEHTASLATTPRRLPGLIIHKSRQPMQFHAQSYGSGWVSDVISALWNTVQLFKNNNYNNFSVCIICRNMGNILRCTIMWKI